MFYNLHLQGPERFLRPLTRTLRSESHSIWQQTAKVFFLHWTISERKLAARSLATLKVGNEKLRRQLQIARWNGRGKSCCNIKSQVAEKKQKFSLTTNATSKRCYLSSLEGSGNRNSLSAGREDIGVRLVMQRVHCFVMEKYCLA